MEPDAVSLTACVHCGLCLPACPTFRVLGDENDSPRGRLYLMKAEEQNRLTSSAALRTHLGRCLACRACETACPADVPYTRLLERTRATLTESRPLSRVGSRMFLWLLTGVPSRPLYGVLRLARRLGFAAVAGRLLLGRIGAAARALAASAPAPSAFAVSHLGAPREPEPDGPSWALLEGCVTRGLFSHVQTATRRVVVERGWREVALPGSTCCGALHAHAGHREDARRLARCTIAAFEASGADRVVSDAAGCSAAMKEYGHLLADESGWAERAQRFADRVRDVSELLDGAGRAADQTEPAQMTRDTARGTNETARGPARVAYDAPCHLLHAQGIDQAPVEALRTIGATVGFSIEPLSSSSECCGGAGTYGLRLPGISRRVLDRKLDEIQAGGYDAVVTGNPGCIMQIGAGLRERGDLTPVLHPVEFVPRAASTWASAAPGALSDE
jgi:glycolate oxidase iron-sulfur subunit